MAKIITGNHRLLKNLNSVEIIKDILSVERIDKRQLLGVGIDVSILVDISRGVIIKAILFSSSQQPIHLEKSLKKYFDVPIYIKNDANAAALTEKWCGKAKGISNIIFTLVVVDRDVFGIGFGVILNFETGKIVSKEIINVTKLLDPKMGNLFYPTTLNSFVKIQQLDCYSNVHLNN